jgi:hypothetical protein
MADKYEHVIRVDEYYDGLRDGVALFSGVPHRFESVAMKTEPWNAEDDRFELTPLPPVTGPTFVARGEFRLSNTAPDPEFAPLSPQEVRWTVVVPGAS